MGNSLIAMALPGERLMHEALCIRRGGEVVRLAEAGIARSDRERVRREQPDAFWVVEVPITAVWDGIDEPPGGSRWYRDPEKLAAPTAPGRGRGSSSRRTWAKLGCPKESLRAIPAFLIGCTRQNDISGWHSDRLALALTRL